MFMAIDKTLSGTGSALRALVLAFGGLAVATLPPGVVMAQQRPVQKPVTVELQSFPTAQAAFDAFVAAVKNDDDAAKAKLFGAAYRRLMPADEVHAAELRQLFLDAYAVSNKVLVKDDREAVLEVGPTGWTLPIPVVKGSDGWRFDIVAGAAKIKERLIGRNELTVIQTLLAGVDAQHEYAVMDPMKTGTRQYARRIQSSPGKKDGLHWETRAGEPESPLGELFAKAQADGANRDVGYHGYHYRLLYAQGPSAQGGARDYIVKDRMIGGFAFIAWPVRYGETGIMTFIVNQDGEVFEKDLGPNTAAAASAVKAFDPDKSWTKADTTP